MKLSIVTVTLNAAAHLPRLIRSLRSQTDPDFEWVVMDGGSSDGTLALLAQATELPLIWRSEPDFGIYDALNKALRLASGEYYLVAGADDVLDPGAVAGYRRLIEETDADIVTTSVRVGAHRVVHRPRGPTWLRGPRAPAPSVAECGTSPLRPCGPV